MKLTPNSNLIPPDLFMLLQDQTPQVQISFALRECPLSAPHIKKNMLGSQSDTLRSLQTLCRSDNTNSSSLSYAAGILIMTASPGAISGKEISLHGSTATCLLAVRIPALLVLLFL